MLTPILAIDEKRSVWLLRLEKRELRNEEIEEIMPAETESKAPRMELVEVNAKPEFIGAIPPSVIEDEFDLQPEANLGPSLDGAPRVRRL